jgi:hypothetical protein
MTHLQPPLLLAFPSAPGFFLRHLSLRTRFSTFHRLGFREALRVAKLFEARSVAFAHATSRCLHALVELAPEAKSTENGHQIIVVRNHPAVKEATSFVLLVLPQAVDLFVVVTRVRWRGDRV